MHYTPIYEQAVFKYFFRGAKPDVVFTLNTNLSDKAPPIARTEHKFVLTKTDKTAQHLVAIAQEKTPKLGFNAGPISVEGNIIQRAECRPPPNQTYFESKRAKVEEAKKDERKVIQIENAGQTYKPTNKREIDIENEMRRKQQRRSLNLLIDWFTFPIFSYENKVRERRCRGSIAQSFPKASVL